MSDSNIETYEFSQADGMPVECYQFFTETATYRYTSKREDVDITLGTGAATHTQHYFSEFIMRGDIEPGTDNSVATMTITVSKDNAVAMLYQGAPPEKPIDVQIIRLHRQDYKKFDVVLYGRITQVSFKDSACNITVTLESWLDKSIPNGLYQYTCNNVLFDQNCRLDKSAWQVKVFIDNVVHRTNIYCAAFANYPDGYFDGGRLYFDNKIRMIASHEGNLCVLKYPFPNDPRNDVIVTPGCDKLFRTCVKRFNNALNFTGFPYCPPTDSEKNPYGTGVYWPESPIVHRDTNGRILNTKF